MTVSELFVAVLLVSSLLGFWRLLWVFGRPGSPPYDHDHRH